MILKYLIQICLLLMLALPASAGHQGMERFQKGDMQASHMAEKDCSAFCDMSAAECPMHLHCVDVKFAPLFIEPVRLFNRGEFLVIDQRFSAGFYQPASPPPRG